MLALGPRDLPMTTPRSATLRLTTLRSATPRPTTLRLTKPRLTTRRLMTLRLTTLPCDRILVTLGLCATVGACDTFAESPTRTNETDMPLPTIRPVPVPTSSVTTVFPFPPTTPTLTSPVNPVPPQSTSTAPTPTITVPSSLPTCPPPPAHAGDAGSAANSSTNGSTSDLVYSSAGQSTADSLDADGGISIASVLVDGGATQGTVGTANDAGARVSLDDASPAPLPSGDTVVVDDLTLLIIFDNSGSMAECWDGKTRWEHANHALRAAIEPAQHSLNVGAIRFPADAECLVEPFESPSQFAFDMGHEFLAHWEAGARYPIGGTPLAAAMIEADKAIQNATTAGLLEERFRVVIITDGEPNCDGSPNLLTTLPTAWRAKGVETRVLGLPGSDSAAALLQSIADAGGGIYEQLTTPGQLHDSAERAAR